jgi:Protein of unknown function with HXXEE motif
MFQFTHPFLRLWPFAAGIGGFALVLFVLIFMKSSTPGVSKFYDYRCLIFLGLGVYMIHQYEESGLDVKGRHFHFQKFLCDFLTFNEVTFEECPATDMFIFATNVGSIYIPAAFSLWYKKRRPLVGVTFYSIHFFNFFAHFLPAILSYWTAGNFYNPGMVSAAFFLPMSLWFVFVVASEGLLKEPIEFLYAFGGGLGMHAFTLNSLFLHEKKVLNGVWFFLFEIGIGFLPYLIGVANPDAKIGPTD